MSKKKRNLFTLLGLCVLLAGCIALYLAVPKGGKGEDDTEQSDDFIVVDQIDSAAITKLEVSKAGKVTWALTKNDGQWQLAEDKQIPLNSEYIEGLFSCLNPVKATKALEKEDAKLAEYGLDEPALTIRLTAGGKEYRYDLGISVPVEGGYYGLSSSGDSIYCLNENLFSTFDISRNVLIQKDELPTMKDENMTYIHVSNKKGKEFEAKAVSEAERISKYSGWNIIKPYEKPLAASIKDWSSKLGYFNSLTFLELIQYDCKDMKQYGLEDPSSVITVKYYEVKDGYTPEATATPSAAASAVGNEGEAVIPEKYRDYKTLQLYIGKKAGENYYVCLKGSKNVYTMTGDVVKNMITIDTYDSMDRSVYATLATDLKGFDVTYGSTTMHMTRTPKADSEKNESGSKNNNIWKVEGHEVPEAEEETFLTPYSAIYLLEFTGKADNSVKPKDKKPVLTMAYHGDNRTVTVKYLPYDGTNFYRVDKDGMDYFLVDKRSVDDAIQKFKNVEKFAK